MKVTILLVLCVFGLAFYFVGKFLDYNVTELVSSNPTFLASAKTENITSGSVITQQTLKEVIEKELEGTKGSYAIAIKHLKTGEVYYKDEHKKYDTGSLYKLWVMGTVYKYIEEGRLKEDEILSQSIPTLNSKFGLGPDVAESTEGSITLSVKDALNQMITISHNYAALLLSDKVKMSSVGNWLKQYKFLESQTGTASTLPQTTAADIAIFYERLYKVELMNKENTEKAIGMLKNQQVKRKLPKYLPGVTIAHKTGELGQDSHDGGIVYTTNGEYIIVILSESSSPAGAEDRIANVSKAVYNYFNR